MTPEDTVRTLLDRHGETFAAEAGITLRDEPAPLWQLLVLSLLLSTRIGSGIALATARELWRAGWGTPAAMRASARRARVVALGRGGYRRYDESTATRLGEAATLVLDRWHGDLRELRDEAEGDPARIARLLQEFTGIGPTGASIFLREAQAVWPVVRPAVDPLVLKGARAAGLPEEPAALAALVDPEDLASLAAALVRVARTPRLLDDPTST